MSAAKPPIPRTVKGKRPAFHDNAAIDRLIAMTLTLASEVSVLRDRLDTLERLGGESGWLKPGAIDAYRPPLDVRTERERAREAYLARVLHILREEVEGLERGETSDAYWRTIETIEGATAKKRAKGAKKKS